MPDRADAHIHLFEGGYRDSFTARPGVRVDERACYASLMAEHAVKAALVVGYAGSDWCLDNNRHIAALAREHGWIRPLAYTTPAELNIDWLRQRAAEGFVGISLYLFAPPSVAALAGVDDAAWAWLAERRWPVSVNAKGATWSAWLAVLGRHPGLRLLVSHLGLPEAQSQPASPEVARQAMAHVLALATGPQVRVKLSGFYALSQPGHDYPHRAAWPCVQALLERFGSGRLLWGSDFSPCLDWVTFPQTLGLLGAMPFLTEAQRVAIEGGNLLALLDDVITGPAGG